MDPDAVAAADDCDVDNHQSVTALAVYLNSKNRLAIWQYYLKKTHT